MKFLSHMFSEKSTRNNAIVLFVGAALFVGIVGSTPKEVVQAQVDQGESCSDPVPIKPNYVLGEFIDSNTIQVTIPAPPDGGSNYDNHEVRIWVAGQETRGTPVSIYSERYSDVAVVGNYDVPVGQSYVVGVRNFNDCESLYSEYTLTSTITPPPPTPKSCLGEVPTHSIQCTGDDEGLTVDTTIDLVPSCSSPTGSAPKCQYYCPAGTTYTVTAGDGGVDEGDSGGGFGGGSGSGGFDTSDYDADAQGDICVPTASFTGEELCGFAWGATDEAPEFGVGWVSFNVKDCSDDTSAPYTSNGQNGCPSAGTALNAYRVTLNQDNKLVGFAWSNNIGWIQFGGLSGFPTGGGTSAENAAITGDEITGNALGWAKAIPIDDAGNSAENQGWDGWIALKGTQWFTDEHKLQLIDGQFSGYAWGDDVVGWLNWGPIAHNPNGVYLCDYKTLTATINAVPNPVEVDAVATLSATAGGTFISEAPVGTPSYQFKCDATGGAQWVPANGQASSVYTCIYNTPGTKTAAVRISDSATPAAVSPVEATTQVEVTDEPVVGGDLTVSCDANPSPAFVNQPFIWDAQVTGDTTPATTNYAYSWEFEETPSYQTPLPHTDTIETTYATIGIKRATVTVHDDDSPVPGEGVCTASVEVKVNPSFIET